MGSCAQKLGSIHELDYYVEPTSWIEPPIPQASSYRTSLAGRPPRQSLYKPLERLLLEQLTWQQAAGHLSGYSIQLYKGFSRQEANELHRKANNMLEASAFLIYKQPHYILWTGFFAHPLEAYTQLSRIKRHFPKAIITPKRISVQKFHSLFR